VVDELLLRCRVVSADDRVQAPVLRFVQLLHMLFVAVLIRMVFARQRAPCFEDLLLCAVGADVEGGEGAWHLLLGEASEWF